MPIRQLVLLVTLVHLYIGLRLVPVLMGLSLAGGMLLAGALVLSALAMPLPFRAQRGRRSSSRGLQWLGLVCMGWFSSLFVLTLLREGVLLGAWVVELLGGSPDRVALASMSAVCTPLLAAAGTLVGFFNARRTARVKRVEVPIQNLPPELAGFTIAQISDIHVGPTIRRGYLQRIVDAVNRLGADVVAITGDLVDGSVPELRDHVAPLGQLKARHGTYVVTGNHEYYAGVQPWIDELRRLGLRVLINEHVVLHARSIKGAQTDEEVLAQALVLAGVTDFTAGHFVAAHASDPVAALRDAPPMVRTRVLLAHQPRSAAAAAQAGFSLQLSGHTHGGQFFPWNFFVPMQQPFTAGLHRLQDMWVYISRGTGYWGPPKRLGAPSEITLLRLVPARG